MPGIIGNAGCDLPSAWTNRDSTNRDRHLPTVGIETPSCAATSLFVKNGRTGQNDPRTLRQACADFLRRTHRSSCSVSSDVNSSNAFGRPGLPQFYPMTTTLRRRTLGECRAIGAGVLVTVDNVARASRWD